jgi:hypothetical protein
MESRTQETPNVLLIICDDLNLVTILTKRREALQCISQLLGTL